MSYVFYQPDKYMTYDIAELIDGEYKGRHSGKTLAELEIERPGIKLMTEEEAQAAMTLQAIRPAVEIVEAEYIAALEVLPPGAWVRNPGSSSFHMRRYDLGNITAIYVNLGNRFYRLHDVATLKHSEIVLRVRAVFPDE